MEANCSTPGSGEPDNILLSAADRGLQYAVNPRHHSNSNITLAVTTLPVQTATRGWWQPHYQRQLPITVRLPVELPYAGTDYYSVHNTLAIHHQLRYHRSSNITLAVTTCLSRLPPGSSGNLTTKKGTYCYTFVHREAPHMYYLLPRTPHA